MISIADGHLGEVRKAILHPDLVGQASHPATATELAGLIGVLIRYADRVTSGFGIPDDRAAGIRRAARRSSQNLRKAQQSLRVPTGSPDRGPELAQAIRATSVSLGCGLDLLASHFATAPQRPSTNATVISAADTGRSLLQLLSDYAKTAAHVAQHASPQAFPPLAKAAFTAHLNGRETGPTPVSAVPLLRVPDRIAPRVGEDLHEALEGITRSVQRLNSTPTNGSVTTSRYLARAATITCHINDRLLCQLSRRMSELDQEHIAGDLLHAAATTRRLSRRWRTVARQWLSLTSQFRDPRNGAAEDASDLIVRLGRLIHVDPDWLPHPRWTFRLIEPEQLAPSRAEAALIGLAALKSAEACNHIANDHRAAVNDIAVLSALQSPPSPNSRPRPSAEILQLLQRYEDIQSVGAGAVLRLGEAMSPLMSESPQIAAERGLIVRRTAQRLTTSDDFPAPIADVLATPRSASRPQTQQPPNSKGRTIH
ncbi:hypothetical protein [Spirillospora sp. NPDC047279]|uniref:hypothetical protein n=1 Tax=Spirillospora sp. NPDC047279 TaxID=3155478 RepID=UPI0033F03E72